MKASIGRRTVAALTALALVLGLGACGGSGSKETGERCFLDLNDQQEKQVLQAQTDSGISNADLATVFNDTPICVVDDDEVEQMLPDDDNEYWLYAFLESHPTAVDSLYYATAVELDSLGMLWLMYTLDGHKTHKKLDHAAKVTKMRYGSNGTPSNFKPPAQRTPPIGYEGSQSTTKTSLSPSPSPSPSQPSNNDTKKKVKTKKR